jgi:hypothetical protein
MALKICERCGQCIERASKGGRFGGALASLASIALSPGTGRAGADSESMASKCRRHASSSHRYATVTHQGGALALLHVTDRLRDLLVIT